MADDLVLVETNSIGYAVVTLNRPRAMNALSIDMCEAFARAVGILEADPTVRVLIVTGNGRAFCAGLDLKELASGVSVNHFTRDNDPVHALDGFSGPIIGAVNGVAVTGGFELALACDVLLASTEARFADTHARVGVLPGWGLSQKLIRIVGPSSAKEISLTGSFVSAEKAHAMRLVSRVVRPELLLEEAVRLAKDMLSALPQMLPVYKKLIDEGYAMNYGSARQMEQERSAKWSQSVGAEAIAQRRTHMQGRARSSQSSAVTASQETLTGMATSVPARGDRK